MILTQNVRLVTAILLTFVSLVADRALASASSVLSAPVDLGDRSNEQPGDKVPATTRDVAGKHSDIDSVGGAVKVTVMLPNDSYRDLLWLVRRHGGTKTGAIKQALGDRVFIDKLHDNGDRLYVKEKDQDVPVLLRFR